MVSERLNLFSSCIVLTLHVPDETGGLGRGDDAYPVEILFSLNLELLFVCSAVVHIFLQWDLLSPLC